ncbi:hypothetical protein ACFPK9_01220 [Rubritalea spongiae]|uniref:Uncharacterized protein n=1 Tax=Rubritalea spongiae TaxID=430797 RepID=A0ABW5DYQ7_9BACT
MGNTQHDTRRGKLPFVANEDLTGKAGFLAKVVSNAGVPESSLPTANDDSTLYLVEEEAIQGAIAGLKPLSPEENAMVWAKGSGSAGDVLVLADVGTAADRGKVRTLPAGAGDYFSPGIAEEDFEDGQLVRFRPFPRPVTVS